MSATAEPKTTGGAVARPGARRRIGVGVIGFGWLGQAHTRSLLRIPTLFENRKFDAELSFDFGSVVGEVESWRANPLSVMQELIEDSHGFATAMLDLQSRMLRA